MRAYLCDAFYISLVWLYQRVMYYCHNSTRASTPSRLYSKCPLYNSFTLGKHNVFPRVEKYISNPWAKALGFEMYFSLGNTSCFPRVKELYSGHFEYNPSCVESLVELLLVLRNFKEDILCYCARVYSDASNLKLKRDIEHPPPELSNSIMYPCVEINKSIFAHLINWNKNK